MSNILMDIPLWDYDDPDELLGIDEKAHPDGHPDFWQHGWGIVDKHHLSLSDEESIFTGFDPNKNETEKVLVLILHSSDNPPPQSDDIEIGFFLDDEDIPYLEEEIEAHTSLNKFLDLRISEIVEECNEENITELILCVCNPHNATIKRPDVPKHINVYFPKGVVDAYKHTSRKEISYELRAKGWAIL